MIYSAEVKGVYVLSALGQGRRFYGTEGPRLQVTGGPGRVGGVEVDISDELEKIMRKVSSVEDPADRVMACGAAYDQLSELIKWLGAYGARGTAAKEAVRKYGSAAAAAERAGLTAATMHRLANG